MGRHLELSHLTEEECERILQVIQRDFDLRQKEKNRLNKIEEEIKDEDTKVAVLGKQKNFNENCCMRCFARFFFIFNQKVQCMKCEYFICKNCSSYSSTEKKYVCNICNKQKELQNQSFEWFYSHIKNRFKRFGSAKVVRSLYKRKTDSDSENDSGYDPSQYSSSLPVGKRSRQTIEGFFTDLMNKDLNPSDLISQIEETNDVTLLKDVDNEVISEHDDVIIEHADVIAELGLASSGASSIERPYTCNLGSGQDTYEAVREQEIQRFRHEVNHIVNEVHRTLDNQTPDSLHITDVLTKYGHLLDTHRLHICTALSNLAQTLHLAVDNQQLQTSDVSSSRTTRHAHVQDTVTKEVENYVGHTIRFRGEETASFNSNSRGLSKDHEETLADAIIQKLLDDRKLREDRRHEKEEAKVRRDLTKLSNQCTISQLQDLLTDTDTEDNMTHNSSTYADTDNDSHISEPLDLENLNTSAVFASTPRYETSYSTPQTRQNKYNTGQDDSDVDLDELVANNSDSTRFNEKAFRPSLASTASIGSSHKTLVSMSVSSSEDVDVTSITLTSPEGDTSSLVKSNLKNQKVGAEVVAEDLKEMAITKSKSKPVAKGRNIRDEMSDPESDVTIEPESELDTPYGSPVNEPIIRRTQVVKEEVMPVFDDDINTPGLFNSLSDTSSYYTGSERKVPLPSFEDSSSNLGIEEVDLDDISRHGDEDNESVTTLESEILFCRSWDVSQPGPLFKDRISAYDNFGERKVGRDDNGPVFMFVPEGQQVFSPKVGDQDVSELSDLSENGDSESDSETDSDQDDVRERSVVRRRKKSKGVLKVTSDFAMQTDGLDEPEELSVDRMDGNNVGHVHITMETTPVTLLSPKEKLDLYRQKKLDEDDPEEEAGDDPEDADPCFVLRPQSVTSPVGEPVRFTCQVTGTKPLDVFWYKEEDTVLQLEDDDHYDVKTYDDKHILEIYNTSDVHRGQYFCIAVNEKGRNHKTFKLRLTENRSEKAAPEFLKSPQDMEVMEGMSVTFRCKVKGYPQPRIIWYKDGKRLRNSDQYTLQKLGNRDYTLRVESATMDDDAEYTVVARNMVGEARAAAQLLIEAKSDEAQRKYADLEERARTEPRDLKSNLPDTDELLKIAEEVHSSRNQVTNTAENMLHSANKYHFDDLDLERSVIDDSVTPVNWNALLLSSIHSQIDEMDRKLNNLQVEVHHTMLTRSDSLTSEDDSYNNNNSSKYLLESSSPPPVTNSLRQSILREHEDMCNMAGAVRRVTSTALEVLTTSDTLMKATKDLPSEENQTELEESTKETRESLVIEKEELDMDREEELHLSYADFELLYKHGNITKEQLKSGKVKRREGEIILKTLQELKKHSLEEEVNKQHELTVEDSPTIDCGLKRIPSKRYKRDYVINRSPTPVRRKWEVSQPTTPKTGDLVKGTVAGTGEEVLDATEESVYMATGGVYSLEQRIKKLQGVAERDDLTEADLGALEDEVARTAAQVTQSERQDTEVSKIEKQVSNLQEQQLGTPSTNIFNFQTPINDLNSPDTPTSQQKPSSPFSPGLIKSPDCPLVVDEKDVELPSVKNLRSMFNKNVEDGQSVRRVHSLTGRDLPRGVREKLAETRVNVVSSSNIRVQNESKITSDTKKADVKKRQPLPETFHPSSSPEVPTQQAFSVFTSSETKDSPQRTPPSSPLSSPSRVMPTSTTKSQSASLTSSLSPITRTTPQSQAVKHQASPASSVGSSSILRKSSEGQRAPRTPPSESTPRKSRNSAIMARAAFWDQRILEGKASDREIKDEEFPTLPGDNFKSTDEN